MALHLSSLACFNGFQPVKSSMLNSNFRNRPSSDHTLYGHVMRLLSGSGRSVSYDVNFVAVFNRSFFRPVFFTAAKKFSSSHGTCMIPNFLFWIYDSISSHVFIVCKPITSINSVFFIEDIDRSYGLKVYQNIGFPYRLYRYIHIDSYFMVQI